MIIAKEIIDKDTIKAEEVGTGKEVIINRADEAPLTFEGYVKEIKRRKIEQIASITDQLNIMAGVLAEYVEAIPEDKRSEVQNNALNAYKEIQNILKNN